jgi:hypothetical protein
VQSEHGGQAIMIGGTIVFDNLAVNTYEIASFRFLYFTAGMFMCGCLEEWSFEELNFFLQLLIAWIIRGNHMYSGVRHLVG